LLCLMIMPGRSWVAGIDMRLKVSSKIAIVGTGDAGTSHWLAGHGDQTP